tara:strand:+ start:1760 stop:3499 length:1740 start_codon:yes stop_codon:yes gene_type:complete
MKVFYKKNNNENLFKQLEKIVEIKDNQNYIPIYNIFFNLNSLNYNSINLDSLSNILDLDKKINYSKFLGKINKNNEIIKNKKFFFKFSPIIDPCKYVIGKFDSSYNILDLPNFNNILELSNNKIMNPYNSSYCDSLFSFLSSKLLNEYNFYNGIDFYGSFIGIKENFTFDISEELDSLDESEFFMNKLNSEFKILNSEIHNKLINETKKNKIKIKINNNIELDVDELSIGKRDKDKNMDQNVHNNISNSNINMLEISHEFIFKDFSNNETSDFLNQKSSHNSNSSTASQVSCNNSSCSSRFSMTDHEEDEDEESETCDEDDNISDAEDEIMCSIKEFPVQSIILECCDETLDDYMRNNNVKDNELESIVLQILFTLITYQKCFSFTHNDLHTNNIVYSKTEKQYLYYKFNNKHYKIPTFKKIYKIIDFGRAIYKFNKHLFFNDSYSKDGDAYSQYNCEPYMNENKSRVEPNYSFDLARLGCSIFDNFIDDLDEIPKLKSEIKNIIISWVFDDNNKNILYKNDGSERYPDFKLYKMIARTVHNHTPQKVLSNKLFDKYTINRKKINKNASIFNIDELEHM